MNDRAMTKKLPLMEVFGPTIQGEGALCGVQTYFLRFGLCDYTCIMCDSMHAVDPKSVKANARWLTAPDVCDAVGEVYNQGTSKAKWMTLSGGNPCMHDLSYIVRNMHENGVKVAVETQGTLCPDWLQDVDHVTISPKSPGMGETYEPERFKDMVHSLLDWDVEFSIKVVVFSNQDLEFAAQVFDDLAEVEVASGLMHTPVKKFLSLGNPYPPGHENVAKLEEGIADAQRILTKAGAERARDDFIKLSLLTEYRLMAEELLHDPRFPDVIFLPQLHVLTWANKAEV